jgi:hypothetical protein
MIQPSTTFKTLIDDDNCFYVEVIIGPFPDELWAELAWRDLASLMAQHERDRLEETEH